MYQCLMSGNEKECNHYLHFLDASISRYNSGSSTLVFHKSIEFYMPPHKKLNHPCFYRYGYRSLHPYSDSQPLNSEISFFKCLTLYQDYNTSVMDKALRKFYKYKSVPTLRSLVLHSYRAIILVFYSS